MTTKTGTFGKGCHLHLIDGSAFIFRAYHALPALTRKSDGLPVGAVMGFCNLIQKILEARRENPEDAPTHAAVIFDYSSKTFRNDIYPQYKAHRPEPPEDLRPQFPLIRDATRAFNLPCIEMEGWEADDIIATYARLAAEAGADVSIVSSDKDLMQLLTPVDTFWDFAGNKKLGYDDIPGAFGVFPEQIADLLALAGDAVDNIPGVPGVGRKTAAALLNHFGSLDVVYANLDQVAEVNVRGAAKLGEKLETHRDIAMISRELTRIPTDVPLDFDATDLHRRAPDLGALNHLCDEAGFGPSFRRQGERLCDLVGVDA